LEHDGWWRAVVRDTLIGIRPAEEGFECFTLPSPSRVDIIRDYFRLEDDLLAIYARLAEADEHLAELVDEFRGLRLLRQDPEETLLSFVCSTANSIPRISQAIEDLSRRYGRHVATWRGTRFYSFPDARVLAEADVEDLRNTVGLGFRGANLKEVARQLTQRPAGWLLGLRNVSYEEARREILGIRGVGRKISDCVCLFSLNKDEAVPVDTHVRQLAARLYLPDLAARTVTPAVYERIASELRERFDGLAGWAQQFLYYEDLLLSRERRADTL